MRPEVLAWETPCHAPRCCRPRRWWTERVRAFGWWLERLGISLQDWALRVERRLARWWRP